MRCVPARDFTVSKAMAWRSAIADDPPYQRASGVWTLAKRQLFVDSLLNGYDVPKIYLHDLRGKHPTRVYAVVDGKQRLATIWEYLTDGFGLADDFHVELANLPDLPGGVRHPRAGERFSELDAAWQRVLRGTYLAVVLIQKATPADVEDLFSRLNNGEPLNAPERRNALSGDASELVRRIVEHRFFRDRVAFGNQRYHHHDAAARILAVEMAAAGGVTEPPDLRAPALDRVIRDNRRIPARRRQALLRTINATLDRMHDVFVDHDPLLTHRTAPALHYHLVRGSDAGWLKPGLSALRSASRPGADGRLREFADLARRRPDEPVSLARRLELLESWVREHGRAPR
jgi:hypothetical protein